ncbi:tRNA-i(6)A37 thiotransferase enzyme MiaB [Thermosyntropha lipolytica DSM 11003]|uniref:tRNA-2-methylthio-N(6)-dimethylallyladenosine synthase n=1 Tax=Thermosyntropha lipolytica DSM 11003 TaxID=1123382 RepID=A0A1M5PLD5_9FIRM|nr:tRNA (N6-isopentenyl adenosine(37)-C2)-methylthiotransferase MiaB [Thermosyntropha lipolytica]SHH02530.1 tRNA-i(6)A37 thiotransferase enzyme MiaB [Thermosyntropha lipolytica DSM 11003]
MAFAYTSLGQDKKYMILTYGCQMNVRDSETIAGLLEAMGYTATDEEKEADLIVFNTCSVRHSAENKVFGKVGEVIGLKRKKPELLIAFGGCMAQTPEARSILKKQGVDVIFGTHNIHELPYLLEEAYTTGKQVIRVWEKAEGIIEDLPVRRQSGISAFVNIMFGCDNFCSYCIVPYTRGRERSRHPDDIIREVKLLAREGYKEVTLLGQNVNSYGKGLEEKVDFADLLKMVCEVEGILRVRFTTSHPKDMSDKLIDTIAREEKMCEHVHVPLQAGSNRILKRMNRHYTREHYLALTARIRDKIPGVAITTDLIVGFPGETEDDFADTLDMVKKVRFDAAFTFMYSPRSGTKAAEFTDQVPLEVKKARLERLNELQYGIATEINKSLEGTVQEVLVEGPSKTDKDKLTSRTRTNRIVIFSGPGDLTGRLVNVKITEARTFSLFGELVEG